GDPLRDFPRRIGGADSRLAEPPNESQRAGRSRSKSEITSEKGRESPHRDAAASGDGRTGGDVGDRRCAFVMGTEPEISFDQGNRASKKGSKRSETGGRQRSVGAAQRTRAGRKNKTG